MPATVPTSATYLADPLRSTIRFAGLLVDDIPAEKFAHMPHPTMNHPAFCLGHLSMYPNRALSLIDRTDLIEDKPGWSELFDAPAECIEKDGHYPSKDEIVNWYRNRHEAILAALTEVPDETFQRENPMDGRMKEMFPTVGSAVNFLVNNHNMLHLGQISAWRRAVGMPSAM